MKMTKKKSGEITFRESFDLMKQQLLTLLKEKGFTEKEINEMTMERVNKELKDISKKYTKLLDVELQKIEEKPSTRPTKPVDLKNMFKEVIAIREKYNMPKSMMFVPDELKISVRRISYDKFHLSYKEFFTYLPNPILKIMMPLTINFLVQIGIPREWITRINENGVGIEADVNFLMIASFILPELLIQKRFEDAEFFSLINRIKESLKMLHDVSEFEFEWNSEIGNKFNNNLNDLVRIIQEHPSIKTEMEAITKKYTQRSDTPESEDKQSNPETKM